MSVSEIVNSQRPTSNSQSGWRMSPVDLGSWELGIGSVRVTLAGLLVLLSSLSAYAQGPSGEAIYKRRCAACHERPADGRTPGRDAIQSMPSSRILRTLDFGAMMTIAYQLNRAEREAVATFLGKPGGDAGPRPEAFCRDRSVSIDTERVADLERVESFADQLALCARCARQAHRRSGAEAQVEMGLWIRGRHLGFLTADRDW